MVPGTKFTIWCLAPTSLIGDDNMLLEYFTDMSFVLVGLIGSIVALLFVYIKKRRA
ncbi:EYxxD motif small membrane protein [Metabacillus arenae]|uniref:EYxxD motif small membrane protein n=1 Tax=Metabacillus arenae TaxID=2771434 RepID=UPI0037C68519